MEINIYKKEWVFKESFDTSYGNMKGGFNLYLEILKEGMSGWGESAPIPVFKEGSGVQYSNTYDLLLKELMEFRENFTNFDNDLNSIKNIYNTFPNFKPETYCAITTALIDLVLKTENKTMSDFLGVKIPSKNSIFSYSIASKEKEELFNKTNKAINEFNVIKYKISNNINKIPWNILRDKKVILDFDGVYNNFDIFRKEILDVIPSDINIILEEPISFKNNEVELKRLFDYISGKNIQIVFDDSVTSLEDTQKILKYFPESGINVKPQKMGGILPILNIIKILPKDNLLMVGCLYETSLSVALSSHIKYLRENVIEDLDADIYTGLDENSPVVTTYGRVLKNNFGVGYNVNINLINKI